MYPDWSALGWFALVVAAIPLALWMFRRSGPGARIAAASMKAVGALPLSASQTLVTVEVGHGDERRWLVAEPCASDAEAARYGAALDALVLRHTGKAAERLAARGER